MPLACFDANSKVSTHCEQTKGEGIDGDYAHANSRFQRL